MSLAVSVVIPVYNASKFIDECIRSLLKQTLTNIEIIMVDDGSTDCSVDIIKHYQKQDSRIKLVQQNNQFAGVARNNGLSIAAGDYVIFLDSDDFFDSFMLNDVYSKAVHENADIVAFGHYLFDDKSKKDIEFSLPKLPQHVISGASLGEKVFTLCWGVPWNKMFKRSFILENTLLFQPIKCNNDEYFCNMALALAQRIICVPKRYVHYRVNNELSIQGIDGKKFKFKILAFSAIREGLESRGLFCDSMKTSYLKVVNNHICRAIESRSTYDELHELYEMLKNDGINLLYGDEVIAGSEAEAIMRAESYDIYLFEKYRTAKLTILDYRKNYVDKDSQEYRIGVFLVTPLKKIKMFIYKIIVGFRK